MKSGEIIVKSAGLGASIASLQSLKNGSTYLDTNIDTMSAKSVSETYDALVQLHLTLQKTEKAFQQLVEKTLQAVTVAKISFDKADTSAGQKFNELSF